jgi:hypothetical protein
LINNISLELTCASQPVLPIGRLIGVPVKVEFMGQELKLYLLLIETK